MFRVECSVWGFITSVQWEICNFQCAVCNVQCAVSSVQRSVLCVKWEVFSAQCAMSSVLCSVCSVQRSVCSVLTFPDLHKHSQLSGVTTAPAIHTDVPYVVLSLKWQSVVCSIKYTIYIVRCKLYSLFRYYTVSNCPYLHLPSRLHLSPPSWLAQIL